MHRVDSDLDRRPLASEETHKFPALLLLLHQPPSERTVEKQQRALPRVEHGVPTSFAVQYDETSQEVLHLRLGDIGHVGRSLVANRFGPPDLVDAHY